ncbi:MAG TPA: hypothetical protein VKQ07_08350 [Jatrophihabitantaceae bacterium]|nr:hypothetical protein [Jatrophihabitantaceae bacterium]
MSGQFRRVGRRLGAVVAGAALVVIALPAATAGAAGAPYTCQGGSIPAGSYGSVVVAGFCQVDSGNVNVSGSFTVNPDAGLLAAFGGSDLHVGMNFIVGSGAIVVLGCEPEAFTCFNDPDQNVGTLSTHHTIGLNFAATGALMVLAHNNQIGGNATQTGGGGGVTCDLFPLGPDGPPAYSTWEDNSIARNASVTGVQTCWMGFIRNTVGNNVNYSNNVLADPDGNEVVTNTVGRNLNCSGNDPSPQIGDSDGDANVIGGQATGQCTNIN